MKATILLLLASSLFSTANADNFVKKFVRDAKQTIEDAKTFEQAKVILSDRIKKAVEESEAINFDAENKARQEKEAKRTEDVKLTAEMEDLYAKNQVKKIKEDMEEAYRKLLAK